MTSSDPGPAAATTGAGDRVTTAAGATEAPIVPAAGRGVTHVADRVVAKIATQAAREALRETQPALSTAPRDATPSPASSARSQVVVSRQGNDGLGQARVRVSVELDYPTRIGARCAAVRRRVSERVEALAGMSVPHVSVHVEQLHGPRPTDRERVL